VSNGYDLIVNGNSVHVQGDGTKPLLSVLRNELGLRGSRFGCGTEQCGACMVLIDGEPSFSCARAIESLAGKSVTRSKGFRPVVRFRRCSRLSSMSRPVSAATASRAS
jgi:Aerobic-type carbon monoxide dehydrogenase, small subunit CoxS/CutS homologs